MVDRKRPQYFENPDRVSEEEERALLSQVRAGNQAKDMLESEAFKSVYEEIRTEIFEEFWGAPLRDAEGMVQLRMLAKAAQGFVSRFEERVETGRMAEEQLARHRAAGDVNG